MSRQDSGAAAGQQAYKPMKYCTCGDLEVMHALSESGQRTSCTSSLCVCKRFLEAPGLPGQPDGIDDDSRDLPEPAKAAERVRAYVTEFGDGLYDVCGGAPLYGRDLEAICRAVSGHA